MTLYLFLFIFATTLSFYFINKNVVYEKFPQRGEGNRPATPEDIEKAVYYAAAEKCKASGNIPDGDTAFDCKYTEETCLKTSKDDGEFLDFHVWKDNKCYAGSMDYKSFCKKQKLTYDEENGTCKTNKNYCESKRMMYDNGDCKLSPGQAFAEFILGKTIVRGFKSIGKG